MLTHLFSYDCNGTGAQNWVINSGTTALQVSGTNYCLDAGSGEWLLRPTRAHPILTHSHSGPYSSGTKMKIWQCYSGITAQTWFYTGDNRIALQNQGMFTSSYLVSRT